MVSTMKTLLIAILCLSPLSAYAGMIKTSSKMINPQFSLSDNTIRTLNRQTIALLKEDDEKAQDALNGRLVSYSCEESDEYATSYFMKCTFIHDLPRGWDWYGFYEVTYKRFGTGPDAVIKHHYRWVPSEFNTPNNGK